MKKGKRRHNPKRVRLRRSYTFAEIAEVYGIHTRTVQRWREQGMEAVDETSKPYLVMGEEVRRFLREKNRKCKHPLEPDEFFCPRCRVARKSLPHRISIEFTDKRLGRYRQAVIRGECEICQCRLTRFSSDKQVPELMKTGLNITEHKTSLVGSGDSSVNVDMSRGQNHENQRQE
jgi:hypothetical protein